MTRLILKLFLFNPLILFLASLSSYSQELEPPHTKVRLVAESSSVQPGTTFLIGIQMTMDPGWHTYWKNPGEAGLATQVRWTLPEGVSAGEVLWPIPHKYLEAGEVLTYGYENETMLIVPMTISSLPAISQTITLKAEVDWLECEKVCIPGNASLELKLSVQSATPEEVNVELFDRTIDKIPELLKRHEPFEISFEARGDVAEIVIEDPRMYLDLGKPEGLDFYPEFQPGLEAGRVVVERTGRTTKLKVPLRRLDSEVIPSGLRGLLVFSTNQGARRGRTIEIPFTGTGPSFNGSAQSTSGILGQTFELEEGAGWDQPVYVYLFFALIGGLILNIMPCVLPVIGLKVFGLVRMGEENPSQIRKLGWFFSLGVLASFVALAVLVILLKIAGEEVGWGFQFQEPVFVMVMSAVVMAFGLSLFGVFEIQLPSRATIGVSGLLTKAGDQGNTSLRSFGEGVFATILATPCTAPILGTALGFAFSQPAATILMVFSFVAVGMALPYLLLTLKPAWMRILPRSGDWMITAKHLMGFLMMATLLWLLYVLGKQVGMEAVIWTCAFLLMIALACWIVGRFATLGSKRPVFFLAWVLAAGIVLGGWFWFARPIVEAKEVLQGGAGDGAAAESGIRWETFSLSLLDRTLSEGESVFIDFTADWCLTCKVNERTVLSDDEVIEAFEKSGIVAMKADWTSRNSDITRLLAKFGRSGVPLYVVFPAGKPTEPIVLPEVITSALVIEAIARGVAGQNGS